LEPEAKPVARRNSRRQVKGGTPSPTITTAAAVAGHSIVASLGSVAVPRKRGPGRPRKTPTPQTAPAGAAKRSVEGDEEAVVHKQKGNGPSLSLILR
jgi:hypothetical protein